MCFVFQSFFLLSRVDRALVAEANTGGKRRPGDAAVLVDTLSSFVPRRQSSGVWVRFPPRYHCASSLQERGGRGARAGAEALKMREIK